MPIGNILKIQPFTRVNDSFVRQSDINASEVLANVHHSIVQFGPNSVETRFQAEFYRHIAIDISVESVFDYPYPYISEKSLRAFACKRMLIVVGPAGVMSTLKNKGFCIFDDFIDQSYDHILDASDRFKTVTKEIHRLCDLPLTIIKQYLAKNIDQLDHNFDNLLELQDKELTTIKDQIHP